MARMIFRKETNTVEEWLLINDDGSLTYHTEASGWAMKGGVNPIDRQMTAAEAKAEWPAYASAIDEAMAK